MALAEEKDGTKTKKELICDKAAHMADGLHVSAILHSNVLIHVVVSDCQVSKSSRIRILLFSGIRMQLIECCSSMPSCLSFVQRNMQYRHFSCLNHLFQNTWLLVVRFVIVQ